MVPRGSGRAAIGKIIFTYLHKFIEILANMTQVSDVAPGPLVLVGIICSVLLVYIWKMHMCIVNIESKTGAISWIFLNFTEFYIFRHKKVLK